MATFYLLCFVLLASAVLLEALRLDSNALLASKALSCSKDCEHGGSSNQSEEVVNATRSYAEREMEVYGRHWWPLEQMPGHHPGRNPTPKELRRNQELEGSYTSYWQSLPRFEPSPLLRKAQEEPFFKLRSWRTAATLVDVPSLPEIPAGGRVLEFICHHKTGENLHTNIKQSLPSGHFHIEDLFEIHPVGRVLSPRKGLWKIHFIRDPVSVIASGYRYHQHKWGSEIWDWGHNKLQDPQCFECSSEDHAAMFDTCQFNCTYFELLNRLDETSGIVTEALSARSTLTSMASVLGLLSEDPSTLHLSINLLKAGYRQTTVCMLKFLGLDGDAALQEEMTNAVQRVTDPDHVTSGLFDNTQVEAYLRNHPVWGKDFREVKDLMGEIFRRQALLWGCPDQEVE